jgi:membrane peptidoglycan carboxypeptidase
MPRTIGRWVLGAAAVGFACLVYAYLTLPDVRSLRTTNPATTMFMELRAAEAHANGKPAHRVQQWVTYARISPDLKRAVLVAEDDAFWQHEGVDFEQMQNHWSSTGRADGMRGGGDHATAGEEPLSIALEEPAAEDARAGDCAAAQPS